MSTPTATSTCNVMEMRGVSGGSIRDLNLIVVEDVNWTVVSGEFWVISGLQGTGKSDFLMLADGMMAPTRARYNAKMRRIFRSSQRCC